MKESIETLRQQIQAIDQELVRLIRQRIQTVLEIGKVKKNHHLPIKDEYREKQVLEYVRNTPHDPVNTRALEDIFKTIMRASLEAQRDAQPNKGVLNDRCHAGRREKNPNRSRHGKTKADEFSGASY